MANADSKKYLQMGKIYPIQNFELEAVEALIPTRAYIIIKYKGKIVGLLNSSGFDGNNSMNNLVQEFKQKQIENPDAFVELLGPYLSQGQKTFKALKILIYED